MPSQIRTVSRSPRIAIVVSHPIQHFCPMYGQLAKRGSWDIHVLFAYELGSKSYFDQGFGREVAWDSLNLNAFSHEFLVRDQIETIVPSKVDSPNTEARLEAFSPDVIIVYGYIQPLQRRTIDWAHKRCIPILMISDSELRSNRVWYREIAKRVLLPSILKKVTAFLTTGDSNEDYYQSYGVSPLKMYRTPFPIDIELYQRAYANRTDLRRQVRHQHQIGDDQIVVTMVGKFEPRKRQRDLIDALAQGGGSTSQAVLMLAGSGPLEADLRKYAESTLGARVIFTGFVRPQDLPRYYAATDIYAHVSDYDPHPLAISEAIYMGCPVVASSAIGSVGPTDDVQIGANGFCFTSGVVSELKEALMHLVSLPHLRASFSEWSHKLAVDHQYLAHGEGLSRAISGIRRWTD